jgi:hypothetical protein
MWDLIVPKAYAATECNPGAADFKLTDCFLLNNQGQTVADVYSKPTVIVDLLVRNLFIAAGIIFFFLIMYAGYQYIAEGKKGVDKAASTLNLAVGGLILMFVAYWIVKIIQILTGAQINF